MAQGTYAPQPIYQGWTDAGAPAAGYKLFTYSAGTTTKANTYTDVDLLVPNANPIILDSAGRAIVILPPIASFKFVQAAPTDTDPPVGTVVTRDNISSVPPLPQRARKTSDQAFVTTTTLANVTDLSFAVGASETWSWEAVIFGNAPLAADWKFTFTGPAAPTQVRFGCLGTGVAGAFAASTASAFGSAVEVEGSALDEMVILKGYLINGVNAGTVQLQSAQVAASGTNSIFHESFITYVRYA